MYPISFFCQLKLECVSCWWVLSDLRLVRYLKTYLAEAVFGLVPLIPDSSYIFLWPARGFSFAFSGTASSQFSGTTFILIFSRSMKWFVPEVFGSEWAQRSQFDQKFFPLKKYFASSDFLLTELYIKLSFEWFCCHWVKIVFDEKINEYFERRAYLLS